MDELAKRGVFEEQPFPFQLVEWLKNEGLGWVKGEAPPGDRQSEEIPLKDYEILLSRLKAWGRDGNPGELLWLLSEGSYRFSVANFFLASFCRWVIEQEIAISPTSLADLSFDEVRDNLLSSGFPQGSYLHRRLYKEEEGCRVLYHWMRSDCGGL